MSFTERLQAAVRRTHNPSVLGLDPMPDYVPDYVSAESDPARRILAFNKMLIDCTHDLIAAVKPQLAYYEALGCDGFDAFLETIRYAAGKGLIVIVDGKRNDIDSTAARYAHAYLEGGFAPFCDALTVNPYLGSDGMTPFLEAAHANGKGLFALVRTSNPSAGDLQDLILQDKRPVYEAVADLVTGWGKPFVGADGYAPLGAVVGATWPKQADALRRRLPHAFILVPGYGAQGGTADDAARLFDEKGGGAVVNASRSLMLAYRKAKASTADQFVTATRAAVSAMRDDLNAALAKAGKVDS